MIAAVGGTRNVIGSRMATPLTEPRPGMAPTNKPTVQPKMIIVRFSGSKAWRRPPPSEIRTVSIAPFAVYSFLSSKSL